jgi:hypothetical protein
LIKKVTRKMHFQTFNKKLGFFWIWGIQGNDCAEKSVYIYLYIHINTYLYMFVNKCKFHIYKYIYIRTYNMYAYTYYRLDTVFIS